MQTLPQTSASARQGDDYNGRVASAASVRSIGLANISCRSLATMCFSLVLVSLCGAAVWWLGIRPTGDVGGACATVVRMRAPPGLDCGPSCIFAIAAINELALEPAKIPYPLCERPEGWSVQDLLNSMKALGWHVSGKKADLQYLELHLMSPRCCAILHVNNNHYVLAFTDSDGVRWIYDPACRSGAVSLKAGLRAYDWDGILLIIRV